MSVINLNDTVPPAPTGVTNMKWQADAGVAPRNISAYMPLMVGDDDPSSPLEAPASGAVPAPKPGDSALGKYLKADGTWEVPVPPMQRFVRTLLIKDTTVGTDVADHVTIFASGTAMRLTGVLRKQIMADLVLQVNLNGAAFIAATIPQATAVDSVLTFNEFATVALADGSVLSAGISASDGTADVNGIASFTLEWEG
jgi:hypothetical protein